MSRYDIEIAHGGDAEEALRMAKWLVGNHIRYFGEKVAECDQIPRQATLFDATEAISVPSSRPDAQTR